MDQVFNSFLLTCILIYYLKYGPHSKLVMNPARMHLDEQGVTVCRLAISQEGLQEVASPKMVSNMDLLTLSEIRRSFNYYNHDHEGHY